MPNDRTIATELATALGTLPYADVSTAIDARPTALRIEGGVWDRLAALHGRGSYEEAISAAFANGRAFLAADDALRGRTPRLVEWTGGRRPPGDEVAPIDLRIDHVYLISCKYLSENVANPSPARLFDGLLATTGSWERGDWYSVVAPMEYQTLYSVCRAHSGLTDLPTTPGNLTVEQRDRLRRALPSRSYPLEARGTYEELCRAVSDASAQRWQRNLRGTSKELMLWRLLRIGNAPYFMLGAHRGKPVRLRVASPWDWRQHYEFRQLEVNPAHAGQPQVDWTASYIHRRTGASDEVRGRIEIRWSHGKFAQPPEAKVYLSTPAASLPGYFPLD